MRWVVGIKLVGEQLLDEGGVIGEVVALWVDDVDELLDSRTRDTWKRLRDGLGVGDGMGLGSGDRRRPVDFRSGFNKRSPLCVAVLGFDCPAVVEDVLIPALLVLCGSIDRMLWQVSEILREFR